VKEGWIIGLAILVTYYTICFSYSHRVSEPQFHCLKEINLVKVCGTMEVFLEWIKDGMYDFCDLPILVKKQMSQSDIEAITICAGTFCGMKPVTDLLTLPITISYQDNYQLYCVMPSNLLKLLDIQKLQLLRRIPRYCH